MAIIIKIAVLSISILTLSACGGGGSNTDNGQAPDPETPVTTTDNSTPEPEVITPEPETPTNEPEVTTPESEPPTNEPEVTSPEPETPPAAAAIVKNQTEASLFLNRATFGPTENDINNLLSKSTYENWVTEQFNTPPTYHLPQVQSLGKKMCANLNDDGSTRVDSWEYRFTAPCLVGSRDKS